MTKFRIYLIIFLILMTAGLVGSRKDHDDKQVMAAVVEEIKEEAAEPERINMVDVIASRRPADWQPTRVYSEPGHTYYPEVMERIIKKEKQAEAWKTELWRSYRADGIQIEFD